MSVSEVNAAVDVITDLKEDIAPRIDSLLNKVSYSVRQYVLDGLKDMLEIADELVIRLRDEVTEEE